MDQDDVSRTSSFIVISGVSFFGICTSNYAIVNDGVIVFGLGMVFYFVLSSCTVPKHS